MSQVTHYSMKTRHHNMVDRCYNPKSPKFHRYGGRGITVCDRWLSEDGLFNFIEDMGICPTGLSLDRVDNNGNYTKDNCKWSTCIEQSNNVECNKLVTFKGETRTIAEWARDYNISWQTLYYRLESGMSISVALTKPTKIVVTYNDEAKSVPEWAAYFSIKRGVLYKRLQRHSIDEVFSDLVLLRSYNENLRPYN